MLSPSQFDRVAQSMADLLVAALTQRPLPQAIEHLYLTDPIADLGRIDGVMFSGGVGEYVYGREDRDFGDMGRRLGGAIRRRIENGALPWPLPTKPWWPSITYFTDRSPTTSWGIFT